MEGLRSLSQDLVDNLTVNISQSESSSLKLIYQPLMINAHQVHECRLKVVHMNGVFHDIITEVVGLTESKARLHAGSSHPHGKATGMVVAAVIIRRQFTL